MSTMHPDLLGFAAWPTLWSVAAVVGTIVNLILLRRRGFPVLASLVVLTVAGCVALLGARVEYRLENGLSLEQLWRGGGQRMPGGFLAFAIAVPMLLRLARLPVLRFLDTIVIGTAVAVAVGRIGCLLQGCCFGVVSDLPWALVFPPGSPAHTSHRIHGWIEGDAPGSLPVHPLQLYFGLDALAIALVLAWRLSRARFEGEVLLWFFVLRCWSKTALEELRGMDLSAGANLSGDVELWVACAATLVLAGAYAWRILDGRQPAVGTPPRHVV
jgi:phosphatidylglycerol---prolipoprotein diacylglyceryl transferase